MADVKNTTSSKFVITKTFTKHGRQMPINSNIYFVDVLFHARCSNVCGALEHAHDFLARETDNFKPICGRILEILLHFMVFPGFNNLPFICFPTNGIILEKKRSESTFFFQNFSRASMVQTWIYRRHQL